MATYSPDFERVHQHAVHLGKDREVDQAEELFDELLGMVDSTYESDFLRTIHTGRLHRDRQFLSVRRYNPEVMPRGDDLALDFGQQAVALAETHEDSVWAWAELYASENVRDRTMVAAAVWHRGDYLNAVGYEASWDYMNYATTQQADPAFNAVYLVEAPLHAARREAMFGYKKRAVLGVIHAKEALNHSVAVGAEQAALATRKFSMFCAMMPAVMVSKTAGSLSVKLKP